MAIIEPVYSVFQGSNITGGMRRALHQTAAAKEAQTENASWRDNDQE